MNSARIAALLEPFIHTTTASGQCNPPKTGEEPRVLSPAQLQSISIYIDILLRWNAHINLTAIRNPEDVVTRHFGESLFAASRLFPMPSLAPSVAKAVDSIGVIGRDREGPSAPTNAPDGQRGAINDAITLADIGSGAGFPGIPIKLWAPHISLTLIESHHKKAAFLREVTRALTLTDVNIQNTRAETLTGATFDIVTLRAVERFESIIPIAVALLAPSGRLALLIGTSQQKQASASLPGFAWSEPVTIPLSRARVLLIGTK